MIHRLSVAFRAVARPSITRWAVSGAVLGVLSAVVLVSIGVVGRPDSPATASDIEREHRPEYVALVTPETKALIGENELLNELVDVHYIDRASEFVTSSQGPGIAGVILDAITVEEVSEEFLPEAYDRGDILVVFNRGQGDVLRGAGSSDAFAESEKAFVPEEVLDPPTREPDLPSPYFTAVVLHRTSGGPTSSSSVGGARVTHRYDPTMFAAVLHSWGRVHTR